MTLPTESAPRDPATHPPFVGDATEGRPTPDFERLVDPRFGVVLGLFRKQLEADEPTALVSYHAFVNNSRRLGQWYGDRISLGTSFNDGPAAWRAAIGEAVERYCGNFVPDTLRKASYEQLRARGEDAVDPTELALYSERQHATRGFPFVPFTRDLEVYWARGRELATGEPAWVPASLVYPNFYLDRLASEPRTNFVNLSGLATGGPTAVGGSREDAERSALEELIERDATTVWWISGSPPRLLDLESEPTLVAALTPADRDDPKPLAYQLFEVPNVFGVPVVGALLQDPKHDIVTIGIASRPEPVAAATKALAEAVHLRGYSRELLEEGGKIWQLMRDGILDRRVYKPYRADRRYMDDYRDDFRDVVDLGCHAQIWLDPRMQRHLERFEKARQETRPVSSITARPIEERHDLRATYLRRLAAEGIRAWSVDVTTPDVASVGLSVVRVVATHLLGNAPAAFPALGGSRLYDDPVRLGLLAERPAEESLVMAPIPHT